MDFVIENYLWFAIGAVVLLMIIIGYFAEKTNFGKKPLKETKEKQDVSNEASDVEVKEEPVEQVNSETDITTPVEALDAVDSLETTEVPEEIKEPLAENDMPEVSMPEEDLNVPFGDQEVKPAEVKEEEPVATSEVPEVPDTPKVEETKDNAISDEADDDVWKF